MKHVSHIIVVDFYTFSYNPVRLSDATYRMDLYKNLSYFEMAVGT